MNLNIGRFDTKKLIVLAAFLTLALPKLAAGTYTITWDGRDDSNRAVATGVYLYRLKTDDFVRSKKMVLLK